jgi:hypothetical protein
MPSQVMSDWGFLRSATIRAKARTHMDMDGHTQSEI